MNAPTGRYEVVLDDRSTELRVRGLAMLPGVLRDGSPCEFVPRRIVIDSTTAPLTDEGTLRVEASSSDRRGHCSWSDGPDRPGRTLADIPPAVRAIVLAARPDLARHL